jgi:hypothetical protein
VVSPFGGKRRAVSSFKLLDVDPSTILGYGKRLCSEEVHMLLYILKVKNLL